MCLQVERLKEAMRGLQQSKDSDMERSGALLAQAHADHAELEAQVAQLQDQLHTRTTEMQCLEKARDAAYQQLQKQQQEMDRVCEVLMRCGLHSNMFGHLLPERAFHNQCTTLTVSHF